ncbi:hypothetical protein NAC44_20615 [Allorhizobium sp. BGMRC 0089]|uniref:GumK N-terminal domain-containing glycosyltransferase n=1 Tax=Allorhizobium sonneratiae TaxID=2934936 RepID=UPI002033DE60|nr:hypothetical protein [Allorhizobium sonneratiae]MCM2294734.1 hypothetical protein [Allorhizobium sonneratiae]
MTSAGETRRVLIVTGQHFAVQPRKVDLHFLADSLLARGASVDFFVWRLSPVSRLLKDGRFDLARRFRFNHWQEMQPGFRQFVWHVPLHPMNFKIGLLNRLAAPVFRRFGRFLPGDVLACLCDYTHILVESGPSPLLTPVLRAHAPQAEIIYHAADRLSTIGVPPVVEEVLSQSLALYDRVHVMAEALREDFPPDVRLDYLPHGIDKAAFDRPSASPYSQGRNAVSLGDMLFDAGAIEVMAAAFPEWTFHLFGRKAEPQQQRGNIIVHGEQPFAAIIPFLKHADLGLAPYRDGAGAAYLSQSSLKMIQYSYCRLPIVAPHFAAKGRAHVMGYDPADPASIRSAFAAACHFDRSIIATGAILDWDETADRLFPMAETEDGCGSRGRR